MQLIELPEGVQVVFRGGVMGAEGAGAAAGGRIGLPA